MGTWGSGILENDASMDFLVELEQKEVQNLFSQLAIQFIKSDSELRDMWRASSNFDGWFKILDALQQYWPKEA